MNPLARIVADADVLAADLLVDGPSRAAMDHIRSHSWLALVASPVLLDDAETLIASLASPSLARDWREKIAPLVERIEHPPDDHPALASAYHGNARHILSLDPGLGSARAGAAIRDRVETSVKHPRAFDTIFRPDAMYPEITGDPYPGPDRDPRV